MESSLSCHTCVTCSHQIGQDFHYHIVSLFSMTGLLDHRNIVFSLLQIIFCCCLPVSPTDTYGNKISIEVILGGIERDENGKIFKAAVFSNHFTLETNFRPIELAAFRSLREQGDFAEQEDELVISDPSIP